MELYTTESGKFVVGEQVFYSCQINRIFVSRKKTDECVITYYSANGKNLIQYSTSDQDYINLLIKNAKINGIDIKETNFAIMSAIGFIMIGAVAIVIVIILVSLFSSGGKPSNDGVYHYQDKNGNWNEIDMNDYHQDGNGNWYYQK